MKNIFPYSVIAFFIMLLSCSQPQRNFPNAGSELQVKVVGIVDGDTFDGIPMLDGKNTIRYRLACVDTPERGQPFSKKAKQKLGDLIFGQIVRIRIEKKKDQYKRPIVWVINEKNQDVQAELLKSGMAWHFKKYNQDVYYSNLEIEARKNRVGLWQDEEPMAPWLWRKK